MGLQGWDVAGLSAGAGHRAGLPWLYWVAQVLLWLVVISALVSAAQYFRRFWSHVDDSIKQRRRLRMLEARKKSQDAVPLCSGRTRRSAISPDGCCRSRLPPPPSTRVPSPTNLR